MYANVIAPAYLYDIIIFFVLFFDDVYCFGINAASASTVLAQSSTTQVSSNTFEFFPQPLLHPQVIRDTFSAGAGPLVMYMGANNLFTISSPAGWVQTLSLPYLLLVECATAVLMCSFCSWW
ncbi:hypothetical protein AVEN_109299-1 [Araneus ventricosus]|uniref:Uncharacterized protein n=1 Tax=Araneus ventricosus TaxID=182803 RepID=A0A4Y2D3E9_ARAVE|nr:hypothetical protein AVEN_109299-1 [Araneus ventricosus]